MILKPYELLNIGVVNLARIISSLEMTRFCDFLGMAHYMFINSFRATI